MTLSFAAIVPRRLPSLFSLSPPYVPGDVGVRGGDDLDDRDDDMILIMVMNTTTMVVVAMVVMVVTLVVMAMMAMPVQYGCYYRCHYRCQYRYPISDIDVDTVGGNGDDDDAMTANKAVEGEQQYSPPELVQAVLDASARSNPLGVEGIFSAMVRDDVFMEEVSYDFERLRVSS